MFISYLNIYLYIRIHNASLLYLFIYLYVNIYIYINVYQCIYDIYIYIYNALLLYFIKCHHALVSIA